MIENYKCCACNECFAEKDSLLCKYCEESMLIAMHDEQLTDEELNRMAEEEEYRQLTETDFNHNNKLHVDK